jgi:hypothetical protein
MINVNKAMGAALNFLPYQCDGEHLNKAGNVFVADMAYQKLKTTNHNPYKEKINYIPTDEVIPMEKLSE